jgi:chromobox protein 1
MSSAVDFEQPDWVPDKKDWEKELKAIDTIEREGKSGTLFVYLHWKNGRKSKVNIDQCYEKCPKAMLRFYEDHLYVPCPIALSPTG